MREIIDIREIIDCDKSEVVHLALTDKSYVFVEADVLLESFKEQSIKCDNGYWVDIELLRYTSVYVLKHEDFSLSDVATGVSVFKCESNVYTFITDNGTNVIKAGELLHVTKETELLAKILLAYKVGKLVNITERDHGIEIDTKVQVKDIDSFNDDDGLLSEEQDEDIGE